MHVSLLAADLGLLRNSNAEPGPLIERLARLISDENVTCAVLSDSAQPDDGTEGPEQVAVALNNPSILVQNVLNDMATKTSLFWVGGRPDGGLVRGTAILSQLPVLNVISRPVADPAAPPILIGQLALALTEDLNLVAGTIDDSREDPRYVEHLMGFLDEAPEIFDRKEQERPRKRGRPPGGRIEKAAERMRITCLAGRLCGLSESDLAVLHERGFHDATLSRGRSSPCDAVFIHPALRAKRVQSYSWTVPSGETDSNPAIYAEFEL